MEIDSDSSCDSVIITGPIPNCSESNSRACTPVTPPRSPCKDDTDSNEDITLEDKAGQIQELEDLVNAAASLPLGAGHHGDGDDTWSGSDTKSIRESKVRSATAKYLKKIKTLQQNKRRQETRIARLTKEVRGLRDKNSVQAAYIDVLCGMLGEDMKEKFRDKQGLGILGNSKGDDDDHLEGEDNHEDGVWALEEESAPKIHTVEGEIREKEREFYCIEDLDDFSKRDDTLPNPGEALQAITQKITGDDEEFPHVTKKSDEVFDDSINRDKSKEFLNEGTLITDVKEGEASINGFVEPLLTTSTDYIGRTKTLCIPELTDPMNLDEMVDY